MVKRIRSHGCVLMLDYDGTLAPIVSDPKKASISSETKDALRRISRVFPTAIISGRALTDVQKRVGIPGIIYAGSHGQEWQIGNRVHRTPLSRVSETTLREATKALRKTLKTYPGLIAERKPGCFALNYRALGTRQKRAFRDGARYSIRRFLEAGVLFVRDDRQTFEISPALEWTKGHVARVIYRTAEKNKSKRKRTPIYIGDSMTDEDAFRAFKNGITIRVGRKKTSAARYYFRTRKEVDGFIGRLAEASRYTAPRRPI